MDFDRVIDRSAVPTLKWDRGYLARHVGNEDAIPMSVADMDLASPPVVVDALARRVQHGIFGYGGKPDGYHRAIEDWFRTRHAWSLSRDDVVAIPSVLSAIAVLIEQHSNEGDGVLVQPPVFFEFKEAIRRTGRRLVKNPLRLEGGRYAMDLVDLEAKAADPSTKLLILCNPHNPVGRVWTREELARVAEICARHGVFVVSDEIHADFAFPPRRYAPFLTVAEDSGVGAAACLSPAKTFNIAGMVDALVAIPDERPREAFRTAVRRTFMTKTNVLTVAAVEAAYSAGGAWLDEAIAYVQGNVELVRDHLAAHDLGVSLVEPDGTFLAWLDFRNLGLDAKELERFLGREAGVALAQGYWFGREGAGFARMTIGCPRSTVEAALARLSDAIDALHERGSPA
jgi:cystathionine beta-lyase